MKGHIRAFSHIMATTRNSHNIRETRRRRIVERGSDRLALISGRIQSLNTDQPSPSEQTMFQDAACYICTQDSDIAVSAHPEDLSLDHNSARQLDHQNNKDIVTEPFLRNVDASKKVFSMAAAFHGQEQAFQDPSSSLQNPAMQHQRKYQSFCNSLTTSEIISAISASENNRICCAVAVAILVIFSYLGFPILGLGIIRSFILLRPFYILLLTNISIVAVRLILRHQGVEIKTGQVNRISSSSGENSLVDQLGKALELGLLLQNIFGAIFMDFSIYAVVLIWGLFLA